MRREHDGPAGVADDGDGRGRGWRNVITRCCIGFGVAMGAPCGAEMVELLEPPPRRDWDAALERLEASASSETRALIASQVRETRGRY